MSRLVLEYFFFVFVAACGVLQIAAAHSKLSGISFFSRPVFGYIFGALAPLGAFTWFFGIENRNVLGLEGCQQFAVFTTAVSSALAITLIVSSVVKARSFSQTASISGGQKPGTTHEGLEVLKEMTYLQAITRSEE